MLGGIAGGAEVEGVAHRQGEAQPGEQHGGHRQKDVAGADGGVSPDAGEGGPQRQQGKVDQGQQGQGGDAQQHQRREVFPPFGEGQQKDEVRRQQLPNKPELLKYALRRHGASPPK